MAASVKARYFVFCTLFFHTRQLVAQTTETNPVSTLPTPTGVPSTVPSNTDIGTCTCDLTGNSCDVNCCCDQDCTEDDKTVFSQCDDVLTLTADDRLCLTSVMMFTNGNTTPAPSVFCIQYDNYKSRNYWKIANQVGSISQLSTYIDTYGSYIYQKSSVSNEYPKTYKAGSPVYTVFSSNAVGTLGVPRQSATSSRCDDNNPAAYLLDQSFTCVREFIDLEVECSTNPALKAQSYYRGFKVVKSPVLLSEGVLNITRAVTPEPVDVNATTPMTDITTTIPQLYNDSYLLDVQIQLPVICLNTLGAEAACDSSTTTLDTTAYYGSTGICVNVVKEVTYTVTHNTSQGISLVQAQFILASVKKSDLPWTQTFKISYVKEGETSVVKRSGNPGYVVGRPVLAGELVTTKQLTPEGAEQTVQHISLNSDPSQWLTVIRSSAAGQCVNDTASRASVNFGENVRSGCLLKISQSNVSTFCVFLQDIIVQSMLGDLTLTDDRSNLYIGTFGNSSPEKTGDWVNVLVEKKPTGSSPSAVGTCNNIVLDVNLEIVYSNLGSLSNPQAKILGAVYRFGQPQVIKYRCIGSYCQPGTDDVSQAIEVTSSVSFVDVTQPAIAVEGERPSFSAKLPHDFFYPFLNSATTVFSPTTTLFACSLTFWFTWYFINIHYY